ncbi:Hypothetical protein, putative [Bodo saltans]|uniref:Pentacotripeptide-repeat region of PRORP domain-containing protein n=1 Tax=Bodo saltans TaxID=75058 RepID=A0A0S4IQD8_BODSA|nr:Hypothetical protein, putative [Bodo saltans]|eukprot:CUF22394.1 Hypothetical protein, putative [Bodo saltans]
MIRRSLSMLQHRMPGSHLHGRKSRNSTEGLAKVLYKKKTATHQMSQNRPDAVTSLLNSSQAEFYAAAVKMTQLHELDRNALIDLLKKLRTFRRLDRAELALRAYREGGRTLSPHHFSLIMAHANEARQWVTALRYWHEASVENKLRPITHAAYLQTMKVAGRWKEAVQHLNVMVQDKIPIEPFALHSIMNTTRSLAPWTVGLQVFSLAVANGVTPNGVVYLVLLRSLSQSLHPHRWHYALSILQGLEGKEERNAGMFNATMDTLASCDRWQQATMLYHSMKKENVVPSRETFRVLMACHRRSAAHCVRALAEAHKNGSPATTEMYYTVFRALLSTSSGNGLNHAVALAETESKRAAADPGNPNYQSTPTSVALLDILLDHGKPSHVDAILKTFMQDIETVVPQATRGLCIVGQTTQRWISEGGRIAVVDHNALMTPRFESLQSHYDHVMIPASSIRALVKKSESTLGGTHTGSMNQWLLSRLRTLIFEEVAPSSSIASGRSDRWLHVLPIVHELMAHKHISVRRRSGGNSEDDDGATDATTSLLDEGDLKLLRQSTGDTAALRLLDEESGADDDAGSPAAATGGGSFSIRGAKSHDTDSSQVVPASSSTHLDNMAGAAAAPAEPQFVKSPLWLTSQEKVIAVALMLKRFNPDTDVHVVTRSHFLLEEVRRWNAHTKAHHGANATVLTEVAMNSVDDLMAKAPPQTPQSVADAERQGAPRVSAARAPTWRSPRADQEDAILS